MLDRRNLIGGGMAIALAGAAGVSANPAEGSQYGLIGKMKSVPGKRGQLIGILLGGTQAMPGNLSYLVAEDLEDPDGIWIIETWSDKAAHAASLKLPSVREAIAKGRPLIAGFEVRHEMRPASVTA